MITSTSGQHISTSWHPPHTPAHSQLACVTKDEEPVVKKCDKEATKPESIPAKSEAEESLEEAPLPSGAIRMSQAAFLVFSQLTLDITAGSSYLCNSR
jgi:hypothetical protein